MDISSIGDIAYNKLLTFAEEEAQEEVKEGEEEKGVDDLDALNDLIIENGALETSEGLFVPEGAFNIGSESHGIFSNSMPDEIPNMFKDHAAPMMNSDETDPSSSPTMDQMTNEMTQAEMQEFNNNMVNSAKSELSEIQAEQKKEWQAASNANSGS